MGSPAIPLDQPPPQPPAAAPSGMAGVAQMIANRQRQQAPQGQILAQGEAVQKVLKQMGEQYPAFQPFADRAIAAIQQGVAEASKPGADQAQAPASDSPATGDSSSATAPAAGNGFPG